MSKKRLVSSQSSVPYLPPLPYLIPVDVFINPSRDQTIKFVHYEKSKKGKKRFQQDGKKGRKSHKG